MTENLEKWYAAEIWLQPAAVDAIEFALNEAGANGTELNLLGKKTDAATGVCVVGYFAKQPDEDVLRDWIAKGLEIYDLPSAAIEKIVVNVFENRDWLAEWKKHWQPTTSGVFVVAPPWKEIEKVAEKIILRIEPGMAFGTGTHETTRLCLQAIEEHFEPQTSFLDVGTGTGVLAIAAAKLSSNTENAANSIIKGCDTDVDSILIARENAELNSVADKIEFFAGSIDENTEQFDFVCANLTADVIAPLLPLLIDKSRKVLVLSGILREQQKLIESELNKLSNSARIIQIMGEWISIVIRRA